MTIEKARTHGLQKKEKEIHVKVRGKRELDEQEATDQHEWGGKNRDAGGERDEEKTIKKNDLSRKLHCFEKPKTSHRVRHQGKNTSWGRNRDARAMP